MTIIVFLVDNSASMNQRTFMGTTLLDITKNAIETFQKIRNKNPNAKFDRLMLLTLDDPPMNIKAGWKENHFQFGNQLKNLQATGTTNVGAGLKNAFDMLNVNRHQSGIDTYGQGRCPFYNEPALIICFTDGGDMVTQSGVQKQLTIPMIDGISGSELTKEPFRWDQRFFSIILNFSAVEYVEQNSESSFVPSADMNPIDSMCDVTGGRSYLVSSHKQISQTLESLAQKSAVHGVVVNFEYVDSANNTDESGTRPVTPTQNNAWKVTKKMIFVKSSAARGHSVGHWPIPESYWPDAKAKSIPGRDAQPVIKFNSPVAPPAAHQMNLLPIDIYELEPSPLTQYILKHSSNKTSSSVCYQTFISQSAKYSEHPFGFLQANVTSQKVFLHVMPYNYPVLLNLVDEIHKNGLKQTPKWKTEFDNYLRAMPGYYGPYLRRALGRAGIHNVVSESLDNCLSFTAVSHLKQVRIRAKQEYDRLNSTVGQSPQPVQFIHVVSGQSGSIVGREDFNEMFQGKNADYAGMASMQKDMKKFNSFPIALPKPNINNAPSSNYTNPFDIPRKDLLSQVAKLRALLLQPTGEAGNQLRNEHRHSLPIAEMGNYHEHLAKAPKPLREIDTAPERLHTFGNPFKVNKNLMIDEADEAVGLGLSGCSSPKRSKRESSSSESAPNPSRSRRKPGPLPRSISLTNRPKTPTLLTPPVSPAPLVDLLTSGSELEDSDTEPELQIIETPPVLEMNGHAESDKRNIIKPTPINSTKPKFTPKLLLQTSMHNHVNGEHGKDNSQIQKLLIKEVKRPGKDYSRLVKLLDEVEGSNVSREMVYRRIVDEAQRFKREKILTIVQHKLKMLLRHSSSSSNGVQNDPNR